MSDIIPTTELPKVQPVNPAEGSFVVIEKPEEDLATTVEDGVKPTTVGDQLGAETTEENKGNEASIPASENKPSAGYDFPPFESEKEADALLDPSKIVLYKNDGNLIPDNV